MTNGYNYIRVNYLFECNTTQNTKISKNKLLYVALYRSSGSCCEAQIRKQLKLLSKSLKILTGHFQNFVKSYFIFLLKS